MKKLLSLLFISLFTIFSANAVQVADNVEIRIGLDFVSKYISKGMCVSYENFQPYTDFRFGNDSTIGIFGLKPWFSVGHSVTKKFYRELDVSVYYTTPGRYFTFEYRYLHYAGMRDSHDEMQLKSIIDLGNFVPLKFIALATVYGKDGKLDTNFVAVYDCVYKKWDFIPLIGVRFGHLEYGYLQFAARRNIELSEKIWMFVQLNANLNTYDIMDFTYQKNFNGWLVCGFIF